VNKEYNLEPWTDDLLEKIFGFVVKSGVFFCIIFLILKKFIPLGVIYLITITL
jgi:hypothetical protein